MAFFVTTGHIGWHACFLRYHAGMPTILSHTSALEVYRFATTGGVAALSRDDLFPLSGKEQHCLLCQKPAAVEIDYLRHAYSGRLTFPVHILVGRAEDRLRSDSVINHYCKNITNAALICATPHAIGSGYINLTSPVLTLAQVASSCSFGALGQLCYEFMGYYRLPMPQAGQVGIPANEDDLFWARLAEKSNAMGQRGFVDAFPLLDLKTLRKIVKACHSVRGFRRLSQLLNYIAEGSASPMETSLTILLCFPPRKGGYGLPLPQLNAKIDLPLSLRGVETKSYYMSDLLWPHERLVVEYDSDAFHTGHNRIASDARRRNVLQSLGYRVITVTKDQVYDTTKCDALAAQIYQQLGRRMRIESRNHFDAKLKLRQDILFNA